MPSLPSSSPAKILPPQQIHHSGRDALIMATLFVPIIGRECSRRFPSLIFWEAFSLLLIFFLVRTLSNFAVAGIIGIIGTASVAIWYLPGPAEFNLEQTLWQIWLLPSEQPLRSWSKPSSTPFKTGPDRRRTERPSSGHRRTAYLVRRGQANPQGNLSQTRPICYHRRWNHPPPARSLALYSSIAQMDAVISLVGRSQDFAAAMSQAQPYVSASDSQLAAKLAKEVAEVRRFLKTGEKPPLLETTATPQMLLLRELEGMVALMPRVIQGSTSLEAFQALSHEPEPESGFLLSDAFTNPDHLRFALSGCLARNSVLCRMCRALLAGPLSTSI